MLKSLRHDLRLIAGLIAENCRVLDVGCGDGALLDYLVNHKGSDARGIELSQNGVNACVSRGLSVIQGDADTDLLDYPEQAFDYVVLSRTLQATRQPEVVLSNLVRIGKHALVSFVNFGHWKKRIELLFRGRFPVNGQMVNWYNSQDIHPCTILDFVMICKNLGLTVEEAMTVDSQGTKKTISTNGISANLCGEQAIFLLSRERF
ncbi:MAG: methionine biosynthesis protein MetW [Rhodospirillaceae bacterium]|nr:methionine biosynthesis protein MetW [Rhodospirillaceae bacterium]